VLLRWHPVVPRQRQKQIVSHEGAELAPAPAAGSNATEAPQVVAQRAAKSRPVLPT
jgi:hypothetical protein